MINPSSPKHFSMIREFHLADFFTLANAVCGMGAVLFSMIYVGSRSVDHFFTAAALVPAALVFDTLDGRIARWRHKHSALGRELDSLADIISFGVAPATLGFAAGMRGGWDWIALFYFVCCGVSRLARFQRDGREPLRGEGCGRLLRRHTDSHKCGAVRHTSLGRLARPARRKSVLGRLVDRTLGSAPAGPAVRPIRNLDGQ